MAEGKLTVGNVEIVALTDIDVDLPIPLSHLFPGVSAEAWAPFQQRYPDAFSGPDVWRAHFGGFLIRSQGRTILVDTGLGSVASNPGTVSAFAAGVDGQLMAGLRAEGVDPENVDTVFFTHLHPDHVGWNLTRRGTSTRATFSKARYVAHQADWQAFQQPEVQKAFPFSFWEETLGPLEQLGVLDLLSGEQTLTSDVTAIHTPGHTPGHMSLRIASRGQRAYIFGDAAHTPAQATEPDWRFSFDMDQAQAIQSRRQLFDWVEAENATLVLCHYHRFGRLVRTQGRRYWQSISV